MRLDSISNPTERRYATTYYNFVKGNSGQLPDNKTISQISTIRLTILRLLVRSIIFSSAPTSTVGSTTAIPSSHHGLYVLGGHHDQPDQPENASTIGHTDEPDDEIVTGTNPPSSTT